jgi:YidC/Oxa1 family membrane protein insertase
MQEAMMKFYSEHSFNPLAGCLPMLIQLPIFIGLYGALSSPHFLAATVHEHFLFLDSLSDTMQGHAGAAMDGTFNVEKGDTFSTDKTILLTLKSGKTQEQEVGNQQKLIQLFPTPLLPGEPAKMTLDFKELGLSDDYKDLVQSADVLVMNNKSRELEKVHFTNVNGALTQQVPTVPGQNKWNVGVLALIVAYGVLTMLYQQVMSTKQPKPAKDDPAAALQGPAMKLMPLMFVVVLFFVPIPAGALIYLVVTTALMFIQTLWVNLTEDRAKTGKSAGKPADQVVDIKADRA